MVARRGGRGADGEVVRIGDVGYNWFFRLRLQILYTEGGASISGGGDAGGKYGLELADSYNTILGIGVHRTEWKIRHRMATGADSTQPGCLLVC